MQLFLCFTSYHTRENNDRHKSLKLLYQQTFGNLEKGAVTSD